MSGAGGASRRSSLTYPAFVERQEPRRSGTLVDVMLIVSGLGMVAALVLLVMQIG
ncbi:MAG TPA: hypothetical protein VFW12_00765 [Candidatus Limnocylindria bacterium]|nr:hypothetical protein [Candidatus Limnocylindria bacterium]